MTEENRVISCKLKKFSAFLQDCKDDPGYEKKLSSEVRFFDCFIYLCDAESRNETTFVFRNGSNAVILDSLIIGINANPMEPERRKKGFFYCEDSILEIVYSRLKDCEIILGSDKNVGKHIIGFSRFENVSFFIRDKSKIAQDIPVFRGKREGRFFLEIKESESRPRDDAQKIEKYFVRMEYSQISDDSDDE